MAEPAATMRPGRAMGWSGVAYGARQIGQLASLAVLARLLDPSAFGVMAMALVVTGLAVVVRDLGAGAAVVGEDRPSPSFLSSQFWIAAVFGIALGGVIAAVGPAAATVFDEPAVAPMLAILAIGFVIGGLGVVPQALLESRLKFRMIAIVEIGAAVVGLGVAVAAALSGLGPLSLAVQSVAQTATSVTLLLLTARWLPTVRPTFVHVAGGLRFGLPVTGFSVLNYAVRSADNALIGATLGAAQLGFYAVPYRLMLVPVTVVTGVTNRVLFPVLVRLADDPEGRRREYLRTLAATSILAFPIAAGMAGGAEAVVSVFLGPGWEASVPVLRLLALVAAAQVIGASMGPLFLATGRTRRLLAWGIVSSAFTVAAFIAGLPLGILGVAAAYAIVSLVLLLPSLWVALPLIGLRASRVLREVAPQAGAALVGGVAVLAVDILLEGVPPLPRLLVEGLTMGAVYLGLMLIIDRPRVQAAWVALRAVSR